MTPAQLRRQAAAKRAEAEKIIREAQEKAIRLITSAAMDEMTAAGMENPRVPSQTQVTKAARLLHNRGLLDTVNSNVELSPEHRLAISKGQNRRREASEPGKATDPFVAVREAAGFTHRALAAELKISPGMLSHHRLPKGDKNSRPIPQSRADKAEKLTGWPADAKHWPCGIVSD